MRKFKKYWALMLPLLIALQSFGESQNIAHIITADPSASTAKAVVKNSIKLAKVTLIVSPDGPVKTLEAARLRVREMKKQNPGQPIEVLIKGGLYSLRKTVVFGLEDSGTEGAPVTYKAFPGEKPVFTGGIPITGWEKISSYPKAVSEKAKGNLWVAKIPKNIGKDWYIRSLYDGEELLERSISSSFKYQDIKRPFDYNSDGKNVTSLLEYEGDPVKPFDRDVYFRENDIRNWDDPRDIELMQTDRPWLATLISLEKIDVEKKIATLSVDPAYQAINPTRKYYVLNAIDYLDQPGEWVVNTQEGLIYMWSKKDIASMNVVAPYLKEFIRVEGKEDGPYVKHLKFEGLTFTQGARDEIEEGDKGLQHDWELYDKDNAVIRFRFAEDCDVSSCTIKSSSANGIRMDLHCQKINIITNHLHHLGGGGIVLSGYGPGTKDENKYNVVHDNYIHHIGQILLHRPAIFITQSGFNQITHNTIHDVPYNGIVVSGCRPHEFYLAKRIPFKRGWISSIRFEECEPYIKKGLSEQSLYRIEYFLPLLHARENNIMMNDVSRTLLKLHDGNAIYFSAMGENNVVERNYLHENYGTAGTIRLDDNPSYTIIKENVITEAERGIGIKGPCELVNNFVFTPMFMRGTVNMVGGNSVRNSIKNELNIFFPPVETKEKNGYFLSGDGKTDYAYHNNLPLMENSIYFSFNKDKPFVPKADMGTDLFTGKPVTLGKDAIKLLYADPMFDEAAMKQRIFRFKKGSPANALGIKPIDLSEVGSTLAK